MGHWYIARARGGPCQASRIAPSSPERRASRARRPGQRRGRDPKRIGEARDLMLFSIPMGVMLSGGSPVDLDGSLFVQLGIFFIAFFILRSLVFRPVMELFDARTAAMEGSREEAKRLETEAEGK